MCTVMVVVVGRTGSYPVDHSRKILNSRKGKKKKKKRRQQPPPPLPTTTRLGFEGKRAVKGLRCIA
jgi:hypothetical protein